RAGHRDAQRVKVGRADSKTTRAQMGTFVGHVPDQRLPTAWCKPGGRRRAGLRLSVAAVVACAVALAIGASPAGAYPTSGFTIWTIAGNGTACATPTGACGDSSTAGSATSANLNNPAGVGVDGSGTVDLADGNERKVR